jgi:hypothetical protein
MAVRPPFAIVNDGVIVTDELDDLGDDEGHALPLDALQGLLCVPCLTPELGGRAAMLHVAAKRNRTEEEASASSSLGDAMRSHAPVVRACLPRHPSRGPRGRRRRSKSQSHVGVTLVCVHAGD